MNDLLGSFTVRHNLHSHNSAIALQLCYLMLQTEVDEVEVLLGRILCR